MGSFSVINAPLAVNVANVALLRDAISVARPGTVITLTAVGPPTAISLTGINKAGAGVHVIMPEDQIYSVVAPNGASNVHFIGGQIARDITAGSLSTTNYGFEVRTGASKISVRGAVLGQSKTAFRAESGTSDILVTDCLFADYRVDATMFQGSWSSPIMRLSVCRNYFGGSTYFPKFCYFGNGDVPQESRSSGDCSAAGGAWLDGDHSDNVQYYQVEDVTICGNVSTEDDSQGIGTFGPDGGPNQEPQAYPWANWVRRVQIWDNVLPGKAIHVIVAIGQDIDVRRNTGSGAPGSIGRMSFRTIKADATLYPNLIPDPGLTAQQTLDLRLKAGDTPPRWYAGLNSVETFYDDGQGVSWTGAMNGSAGVVAPELPRIHFPAWVPIPVRPTPAVQDQPPTFIADGTIQSRAPLAAGVWATCRRGKALYVRPTFAPVSFTYQWYRNGVAISGATSQTYPLVLADQGQSLHCEYVGTNRNGPGVSGRTASAAVPA